MWLFSAWSTSAASSLSFTLAFDAFSIMIPLSLIVVGAMVSFALWHLVGITDVSVFIAGVVASSSPLLSRSGSVSWMSILSFFAGAVGFRSSMLITWPLSVVFLALGVAFNVGLSPSLNNTTSLSSSSRSMRFVLALKSKLESCFPCSGMIAFRKWWYDFYPMVSDVASSAQNAALGIQPWSEFITYCLFPPLFPLIWWLLIVRHTRELTHLDVVVVIGWY